MKIKEGFVVREIAGSIVVVPTGKLVNQARGIFNLQPDTKFVWDLLSEDISEEEIIQKVVQKYKIPDDIAKNDVKELLRKFNEWGILEK